VRSVDKEKHENVLDFSVIPQKAQRKEPFGV
jgi:hypothetical protein